MTGRSSPRIKVKDISAKAKKKGFLFGQGKELLVKIIDIGPNGLSFEFSKIVDPDTKFDFVLNIPGNRTIKCSGEVKSLRKTNASYVLGLEFTKLSPSDKAFLNKENILEIAEINLLDNDMALKDRLRALRLAMGFTQTELSELTRLALKQIKQIEYGMEKKPSQEILQRFADAFGITIDDLIGRNGHSSANRIDRQF